jgi:hypothetical protein
MDNCIILIIIIILIITIVVCCNYTKTIYGGTLVYQNYSKLNTSNLTDILGGADKPSILIVDVANMYIGWYMEKYKTKTTPYMNQDNLISKYLECMKDHYSHFTKHNKGDKVNYVIKNYKFAKKKGKYCKMFVPKLNKRIWNKMDSFVKNRPFAILSVAIDYKTSDYNKWISPSYHYLRGRDDYLCFKLAQMYKKKYINAVIMSNDKYKDYNNFKMVPEFTFTSIQNIKNKISISSQDIKPYSSPIGQIKDYKLINITLQFKFSDPKFTKVSGYKIPNPGEVWKT